MDYCPKDESQSCFCHEQGSYLHIHLRKLTVLAELEGIASGEFWLCIPTCYYLVRDLLMKIKIAQNIAGRVSTSTIG